MQIVMFLTLGLMVFPSQIIPVIGDGILISAFLMLVARPVAVFISLVFFPQISVRKKVFISGVGLRGAVPVIFATFPLFAGIPVAAYLQSCFFYVSNLVLLQELHCPLLPAGYTLACPRNLNGSFP